MRKSLVTIFAVLTALALLLPSMPTARASEVVMVRCELRSVGTPVTTSIQINGSYQVSGRTDIVLSSGSDYTVTNSGNSLTLSGGGIGSVNLGNSFTIQALQSGPAAGAYIYVRDVMRSYLGDMIFTAATGGVRLVNRLYIEDYVIGVVRSEMNDAFPLEALKAQAIAARTYVFKSLETLDRDIYDTEADQVYRGYKSSETNVHRAVTETTGMVMTLMGGYRGCHRPPG